MEWRYEIGQGGETGTGSRLFFGKKEGAKPLKLRDLCMGEVLAELMASLCRSRKNVGYWIWLWESLGYASKVCGLRCELLHLCFSSFEKSLIC